MTVYLVLNQQKPEALQVAQQAAAILQQQGYAGRAFLKWYYRSRNIERKKASLLALAIALLTALFDVCFSFLGYRAANLISLLPFVGICVLYCVSESRHALQVPLKKVSSEKTPFPNDIRRPRSALYRPGEEEPSAKPSCCKPCRKARNKKESPKLLLWLFLPGGRG